MTLAPCRLLTAACSPPMLSPAPKQDHKDQAAGTAASQPRKNSGGGVSLEAAAAHLLTAGAGWLIMQVIKYETTAVFAMRALTWLSCAPHCPQLIMMRCLPVLPCLRNTVQVARAFRSKQRRLQEACGGCLPRLSYTLLGYRP